MDTKRVSILFSLFIFGFATHAWPDSIKSMNNTINPLTITKMDENKGLVQKRIQSAKKTAKPLQKSKARSQPDLPCSDYGVMMRNTKLDVNFLEALEQKRGSLLLTENLHKVICPYDFVQNVWKDRPSYFVGAAEATSSNPQNSQSHLGSYPPENRYFEERRVSAPFKHFQSKKEDLFRQISMGFHFSFTPLSRHMFLDLNAAPSLETGTGIFIPF
jgi:hypothetical protein